jgi:cytochrome c biogenesis protein CcmG/thiol:disulfide interchange protein DsbE
MQSALRWLVVPLLVLPIAWLLVQGFGRDPGAAATPLAGQPMPPFDADTLDGGALSSDELVGRPVLLNFWASWCVPCVEEHAVLADAQRRYGDSVHIVGVLYQDPPEDALGFLARYGDYGWPNLLDESGALAIDYGVTGPPTTLFIDATGIVRDSELGPVTDEVLATKLEPLIAGAEGAAR